MGFLFQTHKDANNQEVAFFTLKWVRSKPSLKFIEITDEAVDLATEYITEKVVGKTSYADCLHIALATMNRADFLVSWNFKHIVNIEKIRGYNSINIKNGYKQLEKRSPREFEKYEED